MKWLTIVASLVVLASAPAGQVLTANQGGRTLLFPMPPDPEAIGTQVGAINTWVSMVTLSTPASIHRLGLVYSEYRGTIVGVGWGGSPFTLACHYTYQLAYVLRIPAGWDGGLVIFYHGTGALSDWKAFEDQFGERNPGRIFHQAADRAISDAALSPSRRWAFFAVNYTGVAPGGAYNTQLVGGEPGCAPGVATQADQDVTIARDHALLAQRLLKLLRDREPTMTLATGHSAGPQKMFLLNAGVDHRRAGGPILVGDNHRTSYDPASGRIFDGFLFLAGAFAAGGGVLPAAQLGGVSAPMIFLANEADRGLPSSVNQVSQLTLNTALNPRALVRLYTVLNTPHIDSDLVLSLGPDGFDFLDDQYYSGGGERLKPVTSAFLDALANWSLGGIAPPRSLFNGEVKTNPARIEFYRTSPPATSLPYVDDVSLDTYIQPPPIVPSAAQRTAWTNARTALDGVIGSIVLPETACRRGSLNFSGSGPVGAWFRALSEQAFLARWGSQAAYQTCRVQAADALQAAGFYDPTVVTVDIEPDRFPNVVDLRSTGRLTVAILSTAGFDATEIVPGSLGLAGASLYGVADAPGDLRPNAVDVNGDGRPDLVVEFRLDRLRFGPKDIIADVWGLTRGHGAFAGSDVVQVIR